MPNELVSIITPSFNSAAYLSDAISSVVRQSYTAWEMLIVDDQSSDNSMDVAEAYAVQDSRIKLLRLSEHAGAAVARNTGISAAKGRYIAFLDSDDSFLADKLSSQIGFMASHHHALTHTYYRAYRESDSEGSTIVKAPLVLTYRDMLKSNQIGCSTAIYDSKTLGKIYMPLIQKRQDYGLWLRILRSGGSAYCFPRVLSHYRIRSGSVSRNKLQLINYNWRLLREFENLGRCVSVYYVGWQAFRGLKKVTYR